MSIKDCKLDTRIDPNDVCRPGRYDNTKCYGANIQTGITELKVNGRLIWTMTGSAEGTTNWNCSDNDPMDQNFTVNLAKNKAIDALFREGCLEGTKQFNNKSVGNKFIIPTSYIGLHIDGYYPLYLTADDAKINSPTNSFHTHKINNKMYFMPNNVEFYHGNYKPNKNYHNSSYESVGEPVAQPVAEPVNQTDIQTDTQNNNIDCQLDFPELQNWQNNWSLTTKSNKRVQSYSWTIKASNVWEVINKKYVIRLAVTNIKGKNICNNFEDYLFSCT